MSVMRALYWRKPSGIVCRAYSSRGSSRLAQSRLDNSISSFDETPFRPDRPSSRLVNPGSTRARPLAEEPPTSPKGTVVQGDGEDSKAEGTTHQVLEYRAAFEQFNPILYVTCLPNTQHGGKVRRELYFSTFTPNRIRLPTVYLSCS
jgi:hypothetical protein